MNICKSCLNCKKFAQHYVKTYNKMGSMNFGHCKQTYKFIDLVKNPNCGIKCDKWEDNTQVKIAEKERIENTIRRMEKELKDIAVLLKTK